MSGARRADGDRAERTRPTAPPVDARREPDVSDVPRADGSRTEQALRTGPPHRAGREPDVSRAAWARARVGWRSGCGQHARDTAREHYGPGPGRECVLLVGARREPDAGVTVTVVGDGPGLTAGGGVR